MLLKEALALLDQAPAGEEPAKLNPSITQAQAVQIVRNAVATLGRPKGKPCGPEDKIDTLMEKRVYQVYRNQKRPRY